MELKLKNRIKTTVAAFAFAFLCAQPSIFAESDAVIGGNSETLINTSWTARDSLLFDEIRSKALSDLGFSPTLFWTGEQWSNISGGLKNGTTWDSLFTFGFEQDFSKLLKKEKMGSFGVSAFYYTASGDFACDYVGAQSCPSNIFSGDMFRVFEIYYTKNFETQSGLFGFRIGQLAADEDFMCLEYADLFLNSNFGAIPSSCSLNLSNAAQAFSQYALATLGGVLFWENEILDLIVGVYNGNCGEDISSNNGFDYSLQDCSVWVQTGYKYKVCSLKGRVQIGGNYHSGSFENFDGGNSQDGFYSFYFGVEQDFLSDADGKTILGGFLRAGWSPKENISAYTKYLDAGVVWFAPLPSRSEDILGVGFSVMELGSAYRNASNYSRCDSMIEVTYRAQLAKAIALQPAFQIYFNSRDNSGGESAAYIAGVRLDVNF